MRPAEHAVSKSNTTGDVNGTTAGGLDEWQQEAELRADELRIDARLLAVEMRRLYPARSPRPTVALADQALPFSTSDQ